MKKIAMVVIFGASVLVAGQSLAQIQIANKTKNYNLIVKDPDNSQVATFINSFIASGETKTGPIIKPGKTTKKFGASWTLLWGELSSFPNKPNNFDLTFTFSKANSKDLAVPLVYTAELTACTTTKCNYANVKWETNPPLPLSNGNGVAITTQIKDNIVLTVNHLASTV